MHRHHQNNDGVVSVSRPMSDSTSNSRQTSSMVWCFNDSNTRTGYCFKEGFRRKNWKRRYFALDSYGLAYYTSEQEMSPIRLIRLADILQVRISFGIHLSRQNVFEVVTPLRVFYIQADSSSDRDEWISAINSHLDRLRSPKFRDVGVQTDSLLSSLWTMNRLLEHRVTSI